MSNQNTFNKTSGKTEDIDKEVHNLMKKNADRHKSTYAIIEDLKQKYEKDSFLNPYRTKNMYNMQTTGQIMMNLNKKELTVRMDNEMGEFTAIENKLPKGYTPKIKIKIENEKTHIKGKKLPS